MASSITARARLIEALQLLAADSLEQLHVFPAYVVAADEIALTIHDVVLLLDQEQSAEAIPEWLISEFREIDRSLDVLSVDREVAFWSNNGLSNDVRWHRLRLKARNLLAALGVPRRRPSIDAEFVPGDPSPDE